MFQIRIPKEIGLGHWELGFGICLEFGISNDEPSSLMIRLNHDIGKKQLA